jgi:hypothetical protein
MVDPPLWVVMHEGELCLTCDHTSTTRPTLATSRRDVVAGLSYGLRWGRGSRVPTAHCFPDLPVTRWGAG